MPCPWERPVLAEMLYNSAPATTAATSQLWLLSTWNVASMTGELNYFIFSYFNLFKSKELYVADGYRAAPLCSLHQAFQWPLLNTAAQGSSLMKGPQDSQITRPPMHHVGAGT